MAERKFIERLTDAVTELRDPFPSKMLGDIETERKSAPDFGQSYSSSLNDAWRFTGWGWNRSRSGEIDYKQEVGALDESSLVMAVVNDTGIALAEAHPSTRTRVENKKWDFNPDHPLAALVRRPNPFNIWADYCGALSVSWWVDGNVYFKMEPSATGEIVELWYLPYFLVEERWPGDGRSPQVPTSGPNKATNSYLSHYQFSAPGREPVLYRQEEVLHVKRFVDTSNLRRGIGAFIPVVREVYGDQAVATFAATLMKNMGIVSYILSPKEKDVSLKETEAEEIKQKFIQRTTGANIGQPLVNAIPLQVDKLGANLQEMDAGNLRKMFESRIAAVTRYPAAYLQFLVGLENGTSYASYEQAREQAYEQVIVPIQRTIADQITEQLLPKFSAPKGTQFFFDTSEVSVLQEDRNKTYSRTAEAFRAGITTLNEARSSLGKPDLGKDGEIQFVPSLNTPMTMERIQQIAQGEVEQDPLDADTLELAKFADMERRMFAAMEEQMKGFEVPK